MNIAAYNTAASDIALDVAVLESLVTETIVADDAMAPLPAFGRGATALFADLHGSVERRAVQVISRRADHARVALADGRTQVVHIDSLSDDIGAPNIAPAEHVSEMVSASEVRQVQADIGLDPLQAYRHVRARMELRRLYDAQRSARTDLALTALADRLAALPTPVAAA